MGTEGIEKKQLEIVRCKKEAMKMRERGKLRHAQQIEQKVHRLNQEIYVEGKNAKMAVENPVTEVN